MSWLKYIKRRKPRFLVIRHPPFNPHFSDVILSWVGENFPELLPLFRLRVLPYHPSGWSNYVLHIPWLQDPVQQWSTKAFERANRLAAKCDERGIPIINRVDRLTNATKFAGAILMARAGVKTPRMALIRDHEEFRETLLGMSLPLFVREDWGHGGMICRADKHDQVRSMPLEQFARPVAIELVDVRDRGDGLYRKYRYVAAGDEGISHHLQISDDWITRGENRVITSITREEELSYISRQDPNHSVLQKARRELGLDFVAFDYGYEKEGNIVVWEANPYPYIRFSTGKLTYRNAALDKTLLAILKMYLQYASLPIPEKIDQGLASHKGSL